LMSQMIYALEKTEFSKKEKEEFYYRWVRKIANNVPETTPMELSTELHKEIRKLSGNDPYKEIKELSTGLLMKNEKMIASHFEKCNSLSEMLSLVVCGNLIDIKSYLELDRLNMETILEKGLSKTFAIDDSRILEEKLDKAQKILYLADNAGEIFFDKYFLIWLKGKGKDVTFVVRGDNILNDVTLKEAEDAGIPKHCSRVIDNGYYAPGTIVDKCSDKFREFYDDADIIISKGQGNLESLIDNKEKDIFFLLLTKCSAISNLMGTNMKDAVIVYNKKL